MKRISSEGITGQSAGLLVDSGVVDVWTARVSMHGRNLAALRRNLGEGEKQRAAQYRFEKDRLRFEVRRGVLRQLLGRYLALPPERVQLATEPHGKPCLAGACARTGLQFNLSHSGDFIYLAFARGFAVGIDVECRRPVPDVLYLARRFFARDEWEALASLDADGQEEAFLRCWTRKEAFVKATGTGLASLAGFSVSVLPGQPAALLACQPAMGPVGSWQVHDLPEEGGCLAAVAAASPKMTVVLRTLAVGG